MAVVSGADVLDAHAALIAAKGAVAAAPDKLRALESEALGLAPLIERGEIAHGDAVACLMKAAIAYGVCLTDARRKSVEHVICMGLAGQAAGVSYVPAGDEAAQLPVSCAPSPLRPLDLGEFLKLRLPPRRSMLALWLSEKGTAMIYSPRGVGKTLLGLSIGYAIASGDNLLEWSAPEPRRVLYIDGEVTAVEMQHRLAAIVAGFDNEAAPDYFRILSADVTENGLPDLATPEGQRVFDDAIGDAECAFVDNISKHCAGPGGRTRRKGGRPCKTGHWLIAAADGPSFLCTTRGKVAVSAGRRSARTC